ncbi:RNA polymerase sigma factor [Cyclobacterium plantarum]|uniref:RNA polymerase sigma factor n=1 Tax=Cyclobacterium plantarum TaxID=2716263 RepID=A0ABX0H871_9BACT|nr:RNA polymerase sigma factor [Cyclobacterium plantarum]NHE58079.1 RNA polymerase sigma factor [Cyclobacterium plantarum]
MKPEKKEILSASHLVLPLSQSESLLKFESNTDEEIWNAFDKGNELAFNYIYRVHVKAMFRYGSQITCDSGLIKDCVQNIFIQLRDKRGSLSSVSHIKGYLFKSLHREIIRKLKKETKFGRDGLHQKETYFPITMSQESILIQREKDEEMRQEVRKALKALTARQRQAILLLYEEGMSYKEIANVMEFSEVKSARKIIYRGLATLKGILKKS